MKRIVIVGASIAGLSAARTLRADGFAGELTVVGAEPHRPYDRTLLSKAALRADADGSPPELATAEELDALAVDWRLGRGARGLDTARRQLLLDDGPLAYDGLVIATGAVPTTVPVLRAAKPLTLRSHADACALRSAVARAGRVAIVGAGFVGCEVAATLREDGVAVTVVDPAPTPMARVLPRELGRAYADRHRRAGVELRLEAAVERTGTDAAGPWLGLGDGTTIRADIVVEAVGARPAVEWLDGAVGVEIGDGVLCDERCRTGAPGVVAAGDVAATWDAAAGRHVRVEHWLHAEQHGAAAARALLAGDDAAPFAAPPMVWSDQYGHHLQVAGRPAADDELILLEGDAVDLDAGFVAAAVRDGVVTGLLAVDRSRAICRTLRRLAPGAPVDRLWAGTGA